MATFSTSSVSSVRAESKAREAEEKRIQERRKSVLVLILRHLVDSGYSDAAAKLEADSGVSLDRYDVADNVDLITAVQEFEEAREMKFGKRPKLFKRQAAESGGEQAQPVRSTSSAPPGGARGASMPAPSRTSSSKKRSQKGAATGERNHSEHSAGRELNVEGSSLARPNDNDGNARSDEVMDGFHVPQKPPPEFQSPEMKELAHSIAKDIFSGNPNVPWDSVAGLDDAKHLLKESVVLPAKYPQFFSGLLKPWRGLLVYGPPGTGKTMLAKAVATAGKTTLFNISASSVVSKWRGDSEKLVRALFDLARHYAPSTIFIDEIDALVGQRDGGSSEHEASRRMKTELMVQLDGLASSDAPVFLLGATNVPWELDQALLRRLEKRIHIPLPDKGARLEMLRTTLANHNPSPEIDLPFLAERTAGFSGADIRLLCKEAAMRPVRRLLSQLESPEAEGDDRQPASVGPILLDDVESALSKTKPSGQSFAERYEEFTRQFGQSVG